jgi:hypothetical protein
MPAHATKIPIGDGHMRRRAAAQAAQKTDEAGRHARRALAEGPQKPGQSWGTRAHCLTEARKAHLLGRHEKVTELLGQANQLARLTTREKARVTR